MRILAETDRPPGIATYIKVHRVPAAGRHRYRVLSAFPWGCWTHWCGNHTEACYCSAEERESNPTNYNHRWKGFLHVMRETSGRHLFLELTDGSSTALLNKLGALQNCRGLLISLWREPEHRRGEIFVVIDDRAGPGCLASLPPEVHPKATLERLWKCKLPAGRNAS